jgi:RsiW-degrading membrane proteinase PrsW (M82 family)
MYQETEFIARASAEEAPPEVYPYRRVWRAVALEIGSMIGMVLIVLVGVLSGVLRDVPSLNWGALLTLIPLATFLWASVRGEQRALQPRQGLLTVALFSALLANGVGVPLVEEVFRPREWLSEAGFFTRVLGYTFSYGVVSEFLKYIAIRYTVWPGRIRARIDGIAYSTAASIGYATVLNIHAIFEREPVVSSQVIRLAINFISQVGFGVIIGYFLAEMALIPRRQPFFLAGGLFAGALMQGLFIGFRGIAAGSGLSVGEINGLFLVVFFALGSMLAVNFLIESVDSRAASLAGIRRIR